MSSKNLPIVAMLSAFMLSGTAMAQSNMAVDPACMMRNADGTEQVDMVKCPDGKTISAQTGTTGSTSPAATTGIIVPMESLQNATVMTASDFIGKRVYTRANEDIGEVNDIIVTNDGKVNAIILGVGGFLGIGEKNVAVSMQSIEMAADGNNMRLVVDASKDQLSSAPTYDTTSRRYTN